MSDPLLTSLGIITRAPFDWGDEPQAKHEPIKTASSSSQTGLESLKQFVQDRDLVDDPVKRVMASLLVKANVPLTTQDSNINKSNRKRYLDILEGDGVVAARDVSIRGLSDRACAELTVESRSSLFGSILRLFDMTKEDKKIAQTGTAAASGSAASGAAVSGSAASGSAATAGEKNVGTELSTAQKTEGAKATVADISGSVIIGTKIAGTEQSAATSNIKIIPPSGSGTAAVKTEGKDTTKADPAPVPVVSIEIINAAKNNPMIANDPIISTAEIVRSVHLTAGPGDIPACMDSKEYTMAALHFLSSNVTYISEDTAKPGDQSLHSWKVLRNTFPVLPLLVAINPEESLEKRVYGRVKPLIELGKEERKQDPDSMDLDPDFRTKVLNLERAFNSSLPYAPKSLKHSPTNEPPFVFQRYVPRRKLCPRIETEGVKEELTLMISGHVTQDSK